MEVKIAESWKKRLAGEFEKAYFKQLVAFIKEEYKKKKIYPPAKEIFRAFDFCSFENTRVVILGQDPYHGRGQANGLCFSVREGLPIPPSLINIFEEIKDDLHIATPESGDLERWAKQGVLLLNAILTVRAHQPGSHRNKGWETFTDAVIKEISEEKEKVVFLLWGSYAQQKGAMVDTNKHFVLTSPHPSPYSAENGFFGNRHFSKTNDYLRANNEKEIAW
ncbi:MAG: uracil-DNA glycosylase [Cytophagales bacterium]|nr:uracil-DNA glycosylase [Cytophagales bacterium]